MGKLTRPVRYNLNPLLIYSGGTNRFKELDLVNRVPEELWKEIHNIVQEAVKKKIPKLKKFKKAKWLSKEALQTAESIR